jgi:predicted HAD superfamily hydrolase
MKYYNCIKNMLKRIYSETLKMLIFLACDIYYVGDMFLRGVLRMKLKLKYAFNRTEGVTRTANYTHECTHLKMETRCKSNKLNIKKIIVIARSSSRVPGTIKVYCDGFDQRMAGRRRDEHLLA